MDTTKKIILSFIIISAVIGVAYIVIGSLQKQDNITSGDVNSAENLIGKDPESLIEITQPDTQVTISSVNTTTTNTNETNKTEQIKTTMNGQHLITIKTDLGDITFQTYDADAPKTVQNFITLANKGYYNGIIFHRVIDGFMIQGGDPTGTGMGGPGYSFEDELNKNTDSYKAGYKKGVLAMANSGPNTNGSQFFIMVADYPLPNNYTIFGKVVTGQDVADSISKQPRDTRSGTDRPLTPIKMSQVIVTDNK